MSFTGFAFYVIAVRYCFDKHLYLTSCLNAHNQTVCTARKMALFIIIQDRQTQVQVLMPWQPP